MYKISDTNIKIEVNLRVSTNGLTYIFPIPLSPTYPVSWELKEWLYKLSYSDEIEFDIQVKHHIINPFNHGGVFFNKDTEKRLRKEGRSEAAIKSLKDNAILALPF